MEVRWSSGKYRIVPASDDCIRSFAHPASEMPAAAKGQFVNPVGIDLMSSIEVRDGSQLAWGPRIDDLAGKSEAFKLVDPFRVGTNVHRLRVRVVEIKLQSTAHSFAQCELQAVVGTIADAAPSVQRGELVIEECERLRASLSR